MGVADRLEDSFPHGTRQGYDRGCRGGFCPAGEEHGLSCRRARSLAAGDYRYQKLAKSGATPAAIAAALGLNPEIASPAMSRRAALPVEPVPAALEAEPQSAPEPDAEPPLESAAPPVPVADTDVEPEPVNARVQPEPVHAAGSKWVIRRAWVAFAPDGAMHGPFAAHQDAMTFVAEKLQPPPPPQRRRVTDEDLAEVRRRHRAGETDSAIARAMNRSQPVVSAWRRKLGLTANGTFQPGRRA